MALKEEENMNSETFFLEIKHIDKKNTLNLVLGLSLFIFSPSP